MKRPRVGAESGKYACPGTPRKESEFSQKAPRQAQPHVNVGVSDLQGVTWTLMATFVPLSWRYVTSAFEPTFNLPSTVVFLSMVKDIVVAALGFVCGSCETEDPDPTVSVNEF